MKLIFYLSLVLFSFFTFGDQAISVTDYQIENICKKEKMKSNCIKKLKEKRFNLQKGNLIEIPLIKYKGK